MKTQTDKTQESQNSITPRVSQEPGNGGTAQLMDYRTSSLDERKLRSSMDSSENTKVPIQRKNNTGLPDNLKSGIENLSGYSMNDVKVHYNSSKPAQLQAHAYAQGTDIHLAPGQEKHLPHEAWHVVQQKQGRVKPTMQFKGKVSINDDAGLEKEADVMGAKALSKSVRMKEHSTRPFAYEISKEQGLVSAKEMEMPKCSSVVQRRLVRPDYNQAGFKQVFLNYVQNANNSGTIENRDIYNQIRRMDMRTLRQMYQAAITYIDNHPTGNRILNLVRNWAHDVQIRIGYNLPVAAGIPSPQARGAGNHDVTIPWNPIMEYVIWNEDYQNQNLNLQPNQYIGNAIGMMSPAAVLLHELGHVEQYIQDQQGYDDSRDVIDDRQKLLSSYNFEWNTGNPSVDPVMEHHNLYKNEHPFAAEAGEPHRDRYRSGWIDSDHSPMFGSPLPQALTPAAHRAKTTRRRHIMQHGLVAGVTYHTQFPVNAGAHAHPYLNGTHYGNTLTMTLNNMQLQTHSADSYLLKLRSQTGNGQWTNLTVLEKRNIFTGMVDFVNMITPLLQNWQQADKHYLRDALILEHGMFVNDPAFNGAYRTTQVNNLLTNIQNNFA